MNAFLTLTPFIFMRIFLFKWINRGAFNAAQKFAPIEDRQKGYYFVYQICQLLLLVVPAFYQISFDSTPMIAGIIFYTLGLLIITLSISAFARPKQSGLFKRAFTSIQDTLCISVTFSFIWESAFGCGPFSI